jgi:hypothetical protein
MSEHEPHVEYEPSMEDILEKLGEFARELGFVSTPEMDALVEGINPQNEAEIIQQWRDIAEVQARLPEKEGHHRSQTGMLVDQIRVNLKAGNIRDVLNSLNDAMILLDELGLFDTSDYLNNLGHSLQAKYGDFRS